MKNRIKKRLTAINEWCEDHAELMTGLGVGLMAGGLVALRCILQTERDLEIDTMVADYNPDKEEFSVTTRNRRGEIKHYMNAPIKNDPEE